MPQESEPGKCIKTNIDESMIPRKLTSSSSGAAPLGVLIVPIPRELSGRIARTTEQSKPEAPVAVRVEE